jgi:predicted nucleotidyltransferase
MGFPSDLAQYRNEIVRIAARNGATDIRIFGSRARGEATPSSDFDFLVTLASGRSLIDLIAIKQDLEDLLGSPVDVVTEAAISPYIRDDIIRDAVAL